MENIETVAINMLILVGLRQGIILQTAADIEGKSDANVIARVSEIWAFLMKSLSQTLLVQIS